jgi:guanylate kinase
MVLPLANAVPPGRLIVICGPAGSGKTTLCERLQAEFPQVRRLVTTTTRNIRPGEIHGRDYFFVSVPEFERRIAAGEMIEWARVHGRYYGSSRADIAQQMARGHDILLNIDVQGAATFRDYAHSDSRLAGRFFSVFIQPRDLGQIRARLIDRGSDDPDEIERRLVSAAHELQLASTFDFRIESGSKDEDYAALLRIYERIRNSATDCQHDG